MNIQWAKQNNQFLCTQACWSWVISATKLMKEIERASFIGKVSLKETLKSNSLQKATEEITSNY